MFHSTCRGVRPYRAKLGPQNLRRSASNGRSTVVPNYSDRYLRDTAPQQPLEKITEKETFPKSSKGHVLPQTSNSQQAMWKMIENGQDSRLELLYTKMDESTAVYRTELSAELIETKNLTVQKNRKELYDLCKQSGDANMAMAIYKLALTKGGASSLRQFDHNMMMQMSLSNENILMFLVFFAQNIKTGDSLSTAMSQVSTARKLIRSILGNNDISIKLTIYTWCVAMQKVCFTDDLTQLSSKVASEAKETLAKLTIDVDQGTLEMIVKQSPFKGLGYSLIELFSNDSKIICDMYNVLGLSQGMSITTFGRVLVALSETGRYDSALKMYNDTSQVTLQCRREYVDHVAVIYAVLGKWDKFCELLTSKYAQIERNTDSESLAEVLTRVREAGGGPSLLDYVDQKVADLLPLKMAMCMAAGDYEAAARVYEADYEASIGNSSQYGRGISKTKRNENPLLAHLLIQAYDRSCEPEKVILLLKQLSPKNITPLMLVNAVQSCVGAYSRADLVKLMKFIQQTEGISKDISVGNAFIRALMRLGGWSEAVTLFNQLGNHVDILSYTYLLEGLVFQRRWKEYSFFLTQLQRSRELTFTPAIYTTMMQYAIARDEVEKAERMLADLEKAAPRIKLSFSHYRYLMGYYTKSKQPDKSSELYKRMSDRGIQPDGVITRIMLTNIKEKYDQADPVQRRTALLLMEAAASDIVATSELLDPGVISPFVREAFWYIETPDSFEKEKAILMVESFLSKYTAKHGGSESMRVLLWILKLEILKPNTDMNVVESCWRRLFDIADHRNSRLKEVRGFRNTKTSKKHAVIMGEALEMYAGVIPKNERALKLARIEEAFKSRRWRVPHTVKE